MRRGVLVGAVVAAAVVGWLWFWPAVLGGQTTYVTTHGTSMEPEFHTGDLALIRPTDRYAVGDVVAYRSELLHTVVMHRIVAVDNGRYTFKGDNNPWLDPEGPTTQDLVGKLAIHVPQGGAWLDILAGPPVIGLGLFVLLATGGTVAGTRNKRRRRPRRASMSRHITTRSGPLKAATALPARLRAMAALVLVLGVAGIGLGAWSWTGPLNQTAAPVPPDTPRMVFSYTAAVGSTPAYDGATVTSPDPVFRKLTNTLQVHYAYQGEPGTIAVTAELSTTSGWHSTMPLAGPARFTDRTYAAGVSLDLQALDARAQAAAAATGIPSGPVSVAVIAHVQGETGRSFQPALKLNLTPLQVTLAGDAKDLTATDTAAAVSPPVVPRTMEVNGWSLTAANARVLSAVLLLAALIGVAAVVHLVRRERPVDEGASIRRRYGSLLVRVRPVTTPPGRPVIDVTAFGTLAKLADRYGLLVLHWTRSGIETFIVQDENNTYRYRAVQAPDPGSVESEIPGSGTPVQGSAGNAPAFAPDQHGTVPADQATSALSPHP